MRGLCKQFKGEVYLTARDEARGKVKPSSAKAHAGTGAKVNFKLLLALAASSHHNSEGFSSNILID